MTKVDVFVTGSCGNFDRMARKASPWRWVGFPASFGVIQPKEGGTLLFDTGYAPRVLAAMSGFPFLLYRNLLPIRLGADAASTLKERDIAPDEVEIIVISHFHPDHIGGLRDFPKARVICSRRAWLEVKGKRGFAALRQGFLGGLIPDDFEDRVLYVEDLPLAGDAFLPEAHLFSWKGERFLLFLLEGHIPGQIGLLVNQDDGQVVMFVADAIWRRSVLDDGIGPHWLAMRVHHDKALYQKTVNDLRQRHLNSPAIRFIATHDPGQLSC